MVQNGVHAFGVTSSRLPRDKFGPFSKNFSRKGTKTPSGVRHFRSFFAAWRLGVKRFSDPKSVVSRGNSLAKNAKGVQRRAGG